jgi:uncharacterized protein YbjT (DUF2867 family)
MRIFITGATGVIGRRVVPLCLTRGHQVTAVTRSAKGRAALEKLGATAVAPKRFITRSLLAGRAAGIPSAGTRGSW